MDDNEANLIDKASTDDPGGHILFLARIVLWVYLPSLVKFGVQLVGSWCATLWWWWEQNSISNESTAGSRQQPGDDGRQQAPALLPKVAVIVPAYNEEVGIVKTMQSVLQNDYPNLQLIVVNDGSTDNTHQLIRDFQTRFRMTSQHQGKTFRYLPTQNGGKARAMNFALGVVDRDAEIIITVDADSVMHREAIRRMVIAFDDDEVAAVAGNVVVGNPSSLIGRIQQVEYLLAFFSKRADSFLARSVHVIGGAAAAYRKTVLDQLLAGGAVFDGSVLTEDIDLSIRILKGNKETRFAHNAIVYTESPSNWEGLKKQRLRWKYGGILTLCKHHSLFFSLSNRSTYLCWFLLPHMVYNQLVQAITPILIWPFVIAYCTKVDIQLLLTATAVIAIVCIIAVLVDELRLYHRFWIFAAPLVFLASVVSEFVEWLAFWGSIRSLVTGKRLKWQEWRRQGMPRMQLIADDVESGDMSGSVSSSQMTRVVSNLRREPSLGAISESRGSSVSSSQSTRVVSNVPRELRLGPICENRRQGGEETGEG